MARLQVGEQMPDFTFDTAFEKGLSLGKAAAGAKKTALLFLRYYGCTLCQYDIAQLAANYDRISAGGGQVFVVLQSEPETISGQIGEGDLPFQIICDPEQTLYKRFEILPAASTAAMLDAKSMIKIAKAKSAGYEHGKYEGNEQQLPAAFVFGPDLRLSFAHYAKSITDMPEPDELAELMAV